MRQIFLSPLANEDLRNIWDHISKDSSFYASRYLERLTGRIRHLAELPQTGHRRFDIADDDIRCYTEKSHIIIYRFDDTHLSVLRIVHGARQLSRITLQ